MLNAGVEGLGRRVLREAEDVATPDAGQAASPGDQQEAQRPHAARDVGVGALVGPAARGGDGVELEAPGDVVGEDAELLPGAVGAVVAGRDDVEGELALEFGDCLLLGAPAAGEGGRRRTPSMSSRRNAADCLESCTLPGRFLTRRMWPVCATWASSG